MNTRDWGMSAETSERASADECACRANEGLPPVPFPPEDVKLT